MHSINKLLEELNVMNLHFNENKINQQSDDFFTVVKPYTQKIDSLLDDLKTNQHIITSYPYFNERKWNLLFKNIQELSVECHYHKTSKKLFNEKIKSVHYDLNYIKTMNDKKEI